MERSSRQTLAVALPDGYDAHRTADAVAGAAAHTAHNSTRQQPRHRGCARASPADFLPADPNPSAPATPSTDA